MLMMGSSTTMVDMLAEMDLLLESLIDLLSLHLDSIEVPFFTGVLRIFQGKYKKWLEGYVNFWFRSHWIISGFTRPLMSSETESLLNTLQLPVC